MAKKVVLGRGSLKSFFYWARFIHIYLSALLFALLIFFCVTGYFLNHLDWFSGSTKNHSIELVVPASVLENLAPKEQVINQENFNLNPLKQWLSSQHGLNNLSSVDYDFEVFEVVFDYSLPAGYASAIFDTENRTLTLEYSKGDLLAVVNDLHKGRHSGEAWSWVIDISAGLIIFFSLTGYAIMFQNKKTRKLAFVFSIAGVVSPIALYFIFVPRILGV